MNNDLTSFGDKREAKNTALQRKTVSDHLSTTGNAPKTADPNL